MTDAKEYGKALFLITEEDGTTEQVLSDIKTVRSVLENNPDYTKLLDTPALTKSERIGLIDEAFGTVTKELRNLIKILCERRATHLFSKVCEAYSNLYDDARGILRAEAVTAVALTPAQTEALTKKLGALTGKSVVIKNTVDGSVLGGMKLRYSGIQLDGTVKSRLDKFEAALRDTVI